MRVTTNRVLCVIGVSAVVLMAIFSSNVLALGGWALVMIWMAKAWDIEDIYDANKASDEGRIIALEEHAASIRAMQAEVSQFKQRLKCEEN